MGQILNSSKYAYIKLAFLKVFFLQISNSNGVHESVMGRCKKIAIDCKSPKSIVSLANSVKFIIKARSINLIPRKFRRLVGRCKKVELQSIANISYKFATCKQSHLSCNDPAVFGMSIMILGYHLLVGIHPDDNLSRATEARTFTFHGKLSQDEYH